MAHFPIVNNLSGHFNNHIGEQIEGNIENYLCEVENILIHNSLQSPIAEEDITEILLELSQ